MEKAELEQYYKLNSYFRLLYDLCEAGSMNMDSLIRLFEHLTNENNIDALRLLDALIFADESARSLIANFVDVLEEISKNIINPLPLQTVLLAMKEGKSFDITLRETSSASGLFSTEQVHPSKSYSIGFQPVAKQLEIIDSLMKKIGASLNGTGLQKFFRKTPNMPPGAEGFVVVPKYRKLAPQYHIAAVRVKDLLEKELPAFTIQIEGFDAQNIGIHQDTEEALVIFNKKFRGDFILLPVQLGQQHGGRSVRCAMGHYLNNSYKEVGLDFVSGAMALLSHPQRMSAPNSHMTCAGALYSFDSADKKYKEYTHALQFAFLGGRHVLRAVPIKEYSEEASVATLFYHKKD